MKNKVLKNLVLEAVSESFINEKLSEAKVKIFLAQFKKLPIEKAIYCITLYQKNLKRKLSQQKLIIESATPLTKVQIKEIEIDYQRTHLVSEVLAEVNPRLLGGLKIQIGDEVFEDTVLNKIEQLGNALES